MRRIFCWPIILGLLALLLITIYGCTKRKNPERALIPPEGTLWTSTVNWVSLEGNAYGDASERLTYVYLPHGYEVTRKYPILYLLHGFGLSSYYFDRVQNIAKTADKLIARKEIQPMIIVMPSAWNSFGGSFYANSEIFVSKSISVGFGGSYEDYISNEFRRFVDESFFVRGKLKPESTLDDSIFYKQNRAICGYDMGGYGALKLAMKYPQFFGSVSAMSPYPTYFTSGEKDTLIGGQSLYKVPQEMINTLFGENGFSSGDTAAYYSMFDSLVEKDIFEMPYTARIFAMASAFSPHPDVPPNILNTDATFFQGIFEEAEGIALPMDAYGNTMYFAWNFLWRKHDLKIILDNLIDNDKNPFEGKDTLIYMDCGNQDQFALAQAQAFHDLLNQKGIAHFYEEYPGYGDFFAGGDNFLYDRLEGILKFHSRRFPKPENTSPPRIDRPDQPQEVVLGETLYVEVSATDLDEDPMVLTAEFISLDGTPISESENPLNDSTNAIFEDFGDGEGLLTFIPKAGQIGTWRVKFRVSDGELWNERVISIRVNES